MACIYDSTNPNDDCSTSTSLLDQVSAAQAGVPISSNPVASQSTSSAVNWSSLVPSILNFGSSLAKDFTQPTTGTSNLRLQVNPTTGQSQWYDPTTGQYVSGPVGTGTSSSSMILLILAALLGLFLIMKPRTVAA